MRSLTIAVAAALVLASPAVAQRMITLSTPDAEYAEAFSVIAGVRPLRDGRLIVSDSKERTVQVISFGGPAMRIGREGSGPNEWLSPSVIAELPGDSSALWDPGNRRFLIIRPDGTPGGELKPAKTSYGAFASMIPRGADAAGHLYFQGSPFVQTATGQAAADSIPILRYDRGRDAADTVAFIHPQPGNAVVSASPDGRGASISNGLANPLVPQDDWVVLPDGRVAVVRGADYHIDFYERRVVRASGPRAAWDRRPVDAAIREVVVEERRRQLSAAVPRSRPNGGGSAMPSGATERFMNLDPWPATTPPFLRRAAIVRSAGRSSQIWVKRTNLKDADPSQYDVFDGTGRVIARVQVPPRTQIVAFGSQIVYAVRSDDDDLQYLQRFRLPAF